MRIIELIANLFRYHRLKKKLKKNNIDTCNKAIDSNNLLLSYKNGE